MKKVFDVRSPFLFEWSDSLYMIVLCKKDSIEYR